MEANDPIIEWEITAHETDTGTFIVGQVVPKEEYKADQEKIISNICSKFGLDSIKVYDRFESSEVTGKRDYQRLKQDKDGYLRVSEGHLQSVSYANHHRTVKVV